PEGKLFKPLAFTKTFALIASIIVALTVIPPAAYLVFRIRRAHRKVLDRLIVVVRIGAAATAVAVVGVVLTRRWEPLGPASGFVRNLAFVAGMIGGVIVVFRLFQLAYPRILGWCLAHKGLFLLLPLAVVVTGATVWLGAPTVFGPLHAGAERVGAGEELRRTTFWREFPGLGKEFMPPLDEGSFLWMPTISVHGSIGAALETMAAQDKAFRSVPEVDMVVGKIGRVESALDPAPISMIETLITYKPEYRTEPDGTRVRQWRDQIKTPKDIWDKLVKAGQVPGSTSAPPLQPIETRRIMLETGFRASMGVRIYGPDPKTIETFGVHVEQLLKKAPWLVATTVQAERVVGKPYIVIDTTTDSAREAMTRYGLNARDVLDAVAVAIGGRTVTTTVEGRQRFGVRVRYQRELRADLESMARTIITSPTGQQVPLSELVGAIRYESGPQVIKSENTFKVGYVTFAQKPGLAEVEVVQKCDAYLKEARKDGRLVLPQGVRYEFAGTYEHQQRSQAVLMVILPLALVIIFMILYFQFRSVPTTSLVFCGIFVAFAGGFILLWLYGQDWFLDWKVFGVSMREVFQVHPINLSVAVWVGFLALFGIATDDGVVMGTYLKQTFAARAPTDVDGVRRAVVTAGTRRVRACLMTTATTILALLPVLTATGRGADIMIPMAIPTFGGMLIEIMTMLVVPVLYCFGREAALKARRAGA
ncbi:MAG: efflux RND transporter permease subunit, partial [Planctomycetota bacterium]